MNKEIRITRFIAEQERICTTEHEVLPIFRIKNDRIIATKMQCPLKHVYEKLAPIAGTIRILYPNGYSYLGSDFAYNEKYFLSAWHNVMPLEEAILTIEAKSSVHWYMKKNWYQDIVLKLLEKWGNLTLPQLIQHSFDEDGNEDLFKVEEIEITKLWINWDMAKKRYEFISQLLDDELKEFEDPCNENEYPFIPLDIVKLENNSSNEEDPVFEIGNISDIGKTIAVIGYPSIIDNSRPYRYKNTPIIQPSVFLSQYVPNWKSVHPGFMYYSNQHYITYKASTIKRNSGSLVCNESGKIIGIHISSRDDINDKSMNYVCGIRLESDIIKNILNV